MDGNPWTGWTFEEDSDGDQVYTMKLTAEDEPFEVRSNDGFGGVKGLDIAGYRFKWEDVDALIDCLRHAQRRWRRSV